MSWLVLIPVFVVLAALPATFLAVAAQPSRATVRAAGVTLMAVPVVVLLVVAVGAMT